MSANSSQGRAEKSSGSIPTRESEPGVYNLHLHMSGVAALNLLLDPSSRDTNDQALVPEGATTLDVAATVNRICGPGQEAATSKALSSAAGLGIPVSYKVGSKLPSSAEGFLYPRATTLEPNCKPTDALQTMVSRFIQQDRSMHFAASAQQNNLTPYSALIIASIAQSEAKYPQDMPKVVRTILNHISARIPLKFDSTSSYACKLQHETNCIYNQIDHPYNTYTHKGLPPTPSTTQEPRPCEPRYIPRRASGCSSSTRTRPDTSSSPRAPRRSRRPARSASRTIGAVADPSRRAAVLGRPITHSLSPVLHRAAYAALDLDWSYEAIDCGVDDLAGMLADRSDWAGFSCTMPLKRAAIALAEDVRPDALAVGAANTLLPRPGGGWIAENTDVTGIVTTVREAGVAPATATVLGAGGTAQAALAALARLGIGRCALLVRDLERTTEVRTTADRSHITLDIALLDATAGALRADLVVSTLPRGAGDSLAHVRWRPNQAVLDVVYDPWPTRLATSAREAGATVLSGALMLLHQAARQ